MKVIILCGGLGTRLREETEYRPKPMVPIGGLPILWHIMKHYATYGHTEFVLCLGYKGQLIKEFFRDIRWHMSSVTLDLSRQAAPIFHETPPEHTWKITLLDTGELTMTGGRLRRALEYCVDDDEDVFVTYGDGLSDVNLTTLMRTHLESKADVTLTAVRPAARFGELMLDGVKVMEFNEKPPVTESYVNGGFFVINRRIQSRLQGDETVFEQQPLRTLAVEGRLSAHRHDGFWQCMDTVRDKDLLEKLWASGRAPWKTW